MKKYLLLLMITLLPFVVSAKTYNINVSSTGNLTVSGTDDTSSFIRLDGNDLYLTNNNHTYNLVSDYKLNIKAISGATIATVTTTKDLYVSGNSDDRITFYQISNTNNESTLTFNSVIINVSMINNFRNLTIKDTNSQDNNISSTGCNSSSHECNLNIDNSTVRIGGDIKYNGVDIKDSTVDFASAVVNREGITTFDINNSTVTGNQFFLVYGDPTKSTFNFKDSSLSVSQITGIVLNGSNESSTIMNFDNCEVSGRFYQVFIKAKESNFTSSINASQVVASNTIFNTTEFMDPHIVDLTDCEVYGMTPELYKRGSTMKLLNTKIDNSSKSSATLVNKGGYSFIKGSTIITKSMDLCEFDIYDSTINVNNFFQITQNSSEGKLYGYINNSTINTNQFNFYGSPYNPFNDDMTPPNTPYLIIEKTRLTANSYMAPSAPVLLRSSKVIVNNSTFMNKIYLKHGYFLNKTNDYEHSAFNYESNIFDTDLNGNSITYMPPVGERPLQPTDDVTSVLLRDKSYITFKIENGTWADGTTDDIVEEYMSFDTFDPNVIPTGMIPNNGYEDGSWDVEVSLEEVDDDYIFTYTFKKKGLVKGIEEITENPKTGIISYSLKCLVLLIVMGFVYFKIYKKTYFMK